MRRLKKGMQVGDYINYVALAILSLLCISPFLYVLSVSFTDPDVYVPLELILIPSKFSLAAYEYVLSSQNFLSALSNSVLVTVIGTVLNLIVTFSLAYPLSKNYIPGVKAMNGLVVFTLIFNAGIVPTYILVKDLGLIDNLAALILPSLTSAWNLVVVRSFMRSLPVEVEEAARIDGCSDIVVFIRIVIPLSMASIAAFTLFFAVANWNAYFAPTVSYTHLTLPTIRLV